MSNEFNYDNDIPVAPSPFVSSQCQFAYDNDLCGRRSVACASCGEDTQLCHEYTEGLCAECLEEPDPRIETSGDEPEPSIPRCQRCNLYFQAFQCQVCGKRICGHCTHALNETSILRCRVHNESEVREEPDPREQPMSDIGKFVFELGMDLNRVYRAGMKAGQK